MYHHPLVITFLYSDCWLLRKSYPVLDSSTMSFLTVTPACLHCLYAKNNNNACFSSKQQQQLSIRLLFSGRGVAPWHNERSHPPYQRKDKTGLFSKFQPRSLNDLLLLRCSMQYIVRMIEYSLLFTSVISLTRRSLAAGHDHSKNEPLLVACTSEKNVMSRVHSVQ
jgi:hypothetical protein